MLGLLDRFEHNYLNIFMFSLAGAEIAPIDMAADSFLFTDAQINR